MAEENTKVRVDEDDYTEQELAETKKSRKAVEKSIGKTQSMEDMGSGSRSGNGMGMLAKAYIAKNVIGSVRTGHMEKKLNRDSKAYQKDLQQSRSHSSGDKTPGDVFASAMNRLLMEKKQEKLEKLKEKIEKRRGREKKIGSLITGVGNAVGQASRTSAMQGSISKLTSNTGGISQRDIPTLVDAREGMYDAEYE